MTRWTDASIVGGAYSDDTKPFSAQDTVNYMVVFAEEGDTRSPKLLRGVPGFYEIADTLSGAPIRKLANIEGTLLVVAGNTLYRVDTNFTCHAVGTIPGVLRASIAHNQVAGGNQAAIANGQSGYVYSTVDGSLTQITDEAFPGARTFDFVDGYITGIDPSGNFAFTSDLADAKSYSSLDRYQAEGSPDKLVGQIVDHREWWLFGERTIEPFQNTGSAQGTFQRAGGTVIDVGAASPYAIVKMDNSTFWLGSDGIVYRANGYTPERISTMPIEQAISRCTLNTAFAFTFEDRGHKVFYLTLLDGHTWGYDVATKEWHRRQSKGLDRWRINDLVKWNGMWIAGDYANGKLYKLDWDVQSEADQPLERLRVTGVLSDSQNAINVNAIQLVIDTGLPSVPSTFRITGDVGNGLAGTAVNEIYHSVNGTSPYRYSILSGSLPDGLSMSPAGVVTGTRGDSGAYTWLVQAIDSRGVRATLRDSSVTFDEPPVYTGTFQVSAIAGANGDAVNSLVDKGQWKFCIADFDIDAGTVSLYVDNVFKGTAPTVEGFERPAVDLCLAGYATGPFGTGGQFRGLLWGAGVFNGAMSQAQRDALWNGGDGVRFSQLAVADPSLFDAIVYAWQLDDAGSASALTEAHGRTALMVEPSGARTAFQDTKFGRVSEFNHAGRARAIGTHSGSLEVSNRCAYFCWVYSDVQEGDDFPAIISRYEGIANYMGLRSFWVSD